MADGCHRLRSKFRNGATTAAVALQIESATAAFDQRTREPIITFRLTEQSGRLFAEFTGSNIGRTVEIRVDGKVVMRPVIREPILGGSVQVSGRFTLNEAKDLADRLNNGTAKVEAEVVDRTRPRGTSRADRLSVRHSPQDHFPQALQGPK